jgi:hypothetical protein
MVAQDTPPPAQPAATPAEQGSPTIDFAKIEQIEESRPNASVRPIVAHTEPGPLPKVAQSKPLSAKRAPLPPASDTARIGQFQEMRLDASLRPIFARFESQPLLKVAQNTPPPPQPAPLPPNSDAARIEQLQERIDQRDVVIRDLLQRVENLERERAAGASARQGPATAAASEAAQTPSPPAPPQASPQTAQASPQPAQASSPPAPQPPGEPAPSGPGSFAVSDEDAQRALERALVQTGAALLPLGRFEFVPSLTYQFRRESQPGQIALTTDGTVLITENVTKTTQVEANALIRVGLPWDAQAEFGFPFDYKSLSATSRVTGAGLSEHTVDVQGAGDLTFSLTKQILAAGDVRPGLFLGGGWNSDFGQTKRTLPLGTGFNELSVGLTAVKRQDPMVFTLGFTYQGTLEKRGFKPGDQYIPSLGMLLAVSPETSLRFSQQISFGGRDKFNGVAVPGSDKVSGIFTFGLLSILGRGLVINLTGGIGETSDAPDLFVQLAFPIRLN